MGLIKNLLEEFKTNEKSNIKDLEIRILDRKDSVKEIKKLIKYAKKELILISPYVDLSENYMEEIIFCEAESKAFIWRLDQHIEDYKFLKDNDFMTARVKNLHSKIYLNENWVIFSSLNLYNASMIGNHEASVMIKRKYLSDKDLKVIVDIIKESIKC